MSRDGRRAAAEGIVPGAITVEPRTDESDGGMALTGAGRAEELAELLGHTMRRLRLGTRTALAPLGLSGSQARVVRLLADGPLRMAAIAERLGVVPRTATDMVDSVDLTGLVVRRMDPADRRSVLVELTASGRLLVEQLDAARLHTARQVFDVLDAAERDALLNLLRALCDRGTCPVCTAQSCAPGQTAESSADEAPAAAAPQSRTPDAGGEQP
jgi:DNA-binding MarR family transcriptional regulator